MLIISFHCAVDLVVSNLFFVSSTSIIDGSQPTQHPSIVGSSSSSDERTDLPMREIFLEARGPRRFGIRFTRSAPSEAGCQCDTSSRCSTIALLCCIVALLRVVHCLPCCCVPLVCWSMGLSIGLGGPTRSFQTLPEGAPREEFADDGVTTLQPRRTGAPHLALAISADLKALITVYYHDLVDSEGSTVVRQAEMHVQVSMLSAPLGTDTPTPTIHRIRLDATATTTDHTKMMACISSDDKHLACCLSCGSVVVFRLQRPRSTKSLLPPLPEWVQPSPDPPRALVAQQPTVLSLSSVTFLEDWIGDHLVLATRDGSIHVYSYRHKSTHDVPEAKDDATSVRSFRLPILCDNEVRIQQIHHTEEQRYMTTTEAFCISMADVVSTAMLHNSHLATLQRSGVVSVWNVHQSLSKPRLVSSFAPTYNDLCEAATFVLGEPSAMRTSHRGGFSLEYDVRTHSLLIASFVQRGTDRFPYVAVWSWMDNVAGWRMISDRPLNVDEAFLSRFMVSRDHDGSLVHIHSTGSVIHATSWTYGALSPSPSLRGASPTLSSVLLTSRSVAFTVSSDPRTQHTMELSFAEAPLPFDYVSACGRPRLAAIGSQGGSSIAVASRRGFCCLQVRNNSPLSEFQGDAKHQFRKCRNAFQWFRFRRTAEEQSFRVHSMTWWEGDGTDGTSDLLVAIVEPLPNETPSDPRQFLSCWAPQELEISSQLLQSAVQMSGGEHPLGVPLPAKFRASRVEILPTSGLDPSERSATALIVGRGGMVAMALQLTYNLAPEGRVRSKNVSAGKSISDPDIFLASRQGATITIGSCRPHGDLGSLSVVLGEGSSRHCVGRGDDTEAPTAQRWLSFRDNKSIVWAIRQYDGSLSSWKPAADECPVNAADELPVNGDKLQSSCLDAEENDSATGYMSSIGTLSDLLHIAPQPLQSDLLVGCSPRSNFGCSVRANQASEPGIMGVPLLRLTSCVVGPPMYAPVLSQILTSRSLSSGPSLRDLGCTHLETLALSVESCLFRLIEEASDSDTARDKERVMGALDAVAEVFAPVVYASMVSDVGRRVEPSCLPTLWQLQSSRGGGFSPTVFTQTLLAAGALHSAVACLPLLEDTATNESACASILRGALDELRRYPFECGFRTCNDELRVVTALFRYSMKFGTTMDSRRSDANGGMDVESDDDESVVPNGTGLSIFCGLGRILGRRKNEQEVAIRAQARGFVAHSLEAPPPRRCPSLLEVLAECIATSAPTDGGWRFVSQLAVALLPHIESVSSDDMDDAWNGLWNHEARVMNENTAELDEIEAEAMESLLDLCLFLLSKVPIGRVHEDLVSVCVTVASLVNRENGGSS